ncbi:unnamed protein product [Blepharisma stoltei]|uniref:TPX2 central domain-containing protein n=1 Tax=Blepharisma stoltei TaxID=1481888 RepID=A0AAU9J4A7_9CILI|nr:unnamed protein product [Blepharisma stoltei]
MELASLNRMVALSRQELRKNNEQSYGHSIIKLMNFLRSKSQENQASLKRFPKRNCEITNKNKERLGISHDYPKVKSNVVIPTAMSMKNIFPSLKKIKFSASPQTKSFKMFQTPLNEEYFHTKAGDKLNRQYSSVIKSAKGADISKLGYSKNAENNDDSIVRPFIKSLSPTSTRRANELPTELSNVIKRIEKHHKTIKKKLDISCEEFSSRNISFLKKNKAMREISFIKDKKEAKELFGNEEIIGWEKDSSPTPTMRSKFFP